MAKARTHSRMDPSSLAPSRGTTFTEKENSTFAVGAFTEESSKETSFTAGEITRGVAGRCTRGLSSKESCQVCTALLYFCAGSYVFKMFL